ncbi:glycosyltransferase [Nostoc sp.]|uniref:glycosyltransferase n=1 Tax=Nostoc sp. TaxID=1180 RepID=UPI002FFCB46B
MIFELSSAPLHPCSSACPHLTFLGWQTTSITAAVLRAGTPSITVPFFADQPIWGEKLTRLGVSPAPIPYKKLSDKTLAAAIEIVLGDEVMRKKAQELGEKIRAEDGVANAVEAFHRHLGLIG